jgi:hypothetical protein
METAQAWRRNKTKDFDKTNELLHTFDAQCLLRKANIAVEII